MQEKRITASKLQSKIPRLERRSLTREVAERIRRLILDAQLIPGSHVVEADLAQVLGVSHGTVRAGLQQVRHEGLLDYRTNRGVFVRRFTSKDAREVYTLRNTLEAMAAGLAATRVTVEAKQDITAVLAKMRRAAQAGDRLAALDADFEFHHLIVSLSGHELLKEHYRLVEMKSRLFMMLTDGFYPDLTHLLSLHKPVASAILAGDSMRATSLAAQLNTADGERLVRKLTQLEAKQNVLAPKRQDRRLVGGVVDRGERTIVIP